MVWKHSFIPCQPLSHTDWEISQTTSLGSSMWQSIIKCFFLYTQYTFCLHPSILLGWLSAASAAWLAAVGSSGHPHVDATHQQTNTEWIK